MKKLEKQVIDGEIVEVEVEVKDENIDDDSDADSDVDSDTDSNSDSDDSDSDSDLGDEKKEVEPWMADDSDQKLSDVPVATHIRMKQKLKGRLSDSNEEIELLREENKALKAGITTPVGRPKVLPKRPKENDYDTIQEYDEAMDEYDEKVHQIRSETSNKEVQIKNAQMRAQENLKKAVDSHYERAAKLIQDNGIDTEVYKKTDFNIREAIETIRPGMGDIITDQIISVMGEGSEKVLYYLGRNKNALNEFKTLLNEDNSGLKISLFLGQHRERLLNTKQKASKAPPPDSDIKGDDTPLSVKDSAFLKRRKAAIKKGNIQLAYNIKKEAKVAGVDVSNW